MKDSHLWQIPKVKLSYENPVPPDNRLKITSSIDAEKILRANWSEDLELCEEFYVLLLNSHSQALGCIHHSKGGINSTNLDPRLIFAAAVTALATGIILAHNHPSGNPKPSEADIALTYQFQQSGDLLQIRVFDHLILTSYGYYSFADDEMLFPSSKLINPTSCRMYQ